MPAYRVEITKYRFPIAGGSTVVAYRYEVHADPDGIVIATEDDLPTRSEAEQRARAAVREQQAADAWYKKSHG
jgi:hypothetical protein